MNWLPLEMEENTCVYDLDPATPWYRATKLDGGSATEFIDRPWGDNDPLHQHPAAEHIKPLRKVVRSDAVHKVRQELPYNVKLAGRWGSWSPYALTHDAYHVAMEVVRDAE
jgi:hypothetical protein